MKHSVNGRHVLVCLTCELHLLGLQKHTKKLLVVLWWLLTAEWRQLIQTHIQDTWWDQSHGHMTFGGSRDRTQGHPWAWLACISSFCCERHSWERLLVLPADLSGGWGLTIPARPCHGCCYPTLPNWTAGVSRKGLRVDRATPADLWTELQISRQCRQDLLQRTISKRVHFPVSFLFYYL